MKSCCLEVLNLVVCIDVVCSLVLKSCIEVLKYGVWVM